MKILAIGTSGKNCTVAISEDKILIKEINITDGLTHSETLMPAIDRILKETNIELQDIDAYAVSIGPGSFTGIRIGVATIKGLCLGVDKPVLAVPSLLGLAYNKKEFDGYIVSCIDARNDNVYAGIYKNENGILKQVGDYISDNIEVLKERISSLDKAYIMINDTDTYEYASKIAEAGYDLYSQGIITDGVHVSPLYLKKSQAERELEEKNDNN
ncbi:MAG: tRNA (adenosine(37)-N6)-threonylcarbamoyltransferase complex dimerization subunit type 1 TsaB [Clostridia bacterium]|nr:tRNA (adenosine(37)-N6)-threonylcarbamoyltransferase complex dimerization subunit type 1 TsaB [Clostridia bacterium]